MPAKQCESIAGMARSYGFKNIARAAPAALFVFENWP